MENYNRRVNTKYTIKGIGMLSPFAILSKTMNSVHGPKYILCMNFLIMYYISEFIHGLVAFFFLT